MSGLRWSIQNGDLEETNTNVNEQMDGRTPLHFASDYGQTEVVRYLLSIGADVNVSCCFDGLYGIKVVDAHGITPLLAAIWEGHMETVKLLGARTDRTAPDGTCYADCAESAEMKRLLGTQNCC